MNAPCPEGAPAYRQAGTIHENLKGYGHETRDTDTLFSN